MDWTAVFDETGEEDLIITQLMGEHPTEPLTARIVATLYPHHDGDENEIAGHHRLMNLPTVSSSSYTLKALYYLSINYILGVGCLGVPYAFARAGFLLCTAIVLLVTLFSYMTVMWVAETGARYELSLQRQPFDKEVTESTRLIRRAASHDGPDSSQRYEVIDLVSHYLGPIHKVLYQTSLVFLMYVGLLAYTQVFCGSISVLIWQDAPMGLSQLVFGMMVIPLSCMELDEQVSIQSFMAAARFLAIFIMVAGSLVALFVDDSLGAPPHWAEVEPDRMSYTASFSGFGVAFSTALFSQLFQHSVPGLLRPLQDQPQMINKAPKVFGASLLTTCSFYLLLGTTAASYFGAGTNSSVNLNFANFSFGFDEATLYPWVLRILHLLAGIVVMFPALDTISVFPLIANTLGNNLYAATSPSFLKWVARHLVKFQHVVQSASPRRYSDLELVDRKALLKQASRISTILWRLVAAIPPLVGSIWATDLSFSLLLSGVAGLYVAFFAPSLLHIASCRLVTDRTIFTGWYSSTIFCYPVIAFACFALYVVVSQVDDAWQVMHPRL